MQTELSSMQNISADSTKLLTDKLALSRELASLKPELEHLRSESLANQHLIPEKLALESKVRTVATELEDAKNTIARLQNEDTSKADSSMEVHHLKRDLVDLQKKLTKAQKLATQRDDGKSNELGDLETKLEDATSKNQKLQKDLVRAQKQAKKDAGSDSSQLEEITSQLAKEKAERQKLEKANDTARARAEADWNAQKAVLEDRLSQFRTKLKSTKEKLRDAEAELEEARSNAAASAAVAPTASDKVQAVKNPRKRKAAQLDPDAAIGTPGDAQNKRSKRAPSVVGEKSTFSITPFLNRTSSVSLAPEAGQQLEAGQDEPMASIEDNEDGSNDSPTISRPTVTTRDAGGNNVLGDASARTNAKPKPARKGTPARPTLEKVPEEGSESGEAGHEDEGGGSNQENEDPELAKSQAKVTTQKVAKPKPALKPRKSLASFASFRDASLQPDAGRGQQAAMPKKRRKLGNGPKTIFDEDDENDDAGDNASSTFGKFGTSIGGQRLLGGLQQQRGFGAFGGGAPGRGLLAKNRNLKGPVQVADGFAFSPLKKERRAMREASMTA